MTSRIIQYHSVEQSTQQRLDPGFAQDRSLSRLILPQNLLQEIACAVTARDEPITHDTRLESIAELALKVAATEDAAGNSQPRAVRSSTSKVQNAATTTKAPKGCARLYDIDVVNRILTRVKLGLEGKGERADLLKKSCQALIERGPWRTVAKPLRDWRGRLQVLRVTYPNGRVVFDYLESEFVLAEHIRRGVTLTPFVLVGPPGVGKSVLVQAIQSLLNVPLHRVQVEISSHASTLVGTELHWSSAGSGLLFQALALGEVINPIVMLDELDKVQTRDDYPNVHKVLYSLLERDSARNFHDASLPDLALDASQVRWMGTANTMATIPLAIQSRMRFFEIPELTTEQAHSVVHSMDALLRKELKLQDWPELGEDTVTRLAQESPRRMRLLLRSGYANALVRGARRLTLDDLATSDMPSDQAAANTTAQQKDLVDSMEGLLTLTNFAALRAIELEQRIRQAEHLWGYLPWTSEMVH